MSALIKQVRRRPSLGITIGFAVAILALVTFIPFSFNNTVGYEVAIAGVNKDLAMDNEKINDLMAALGLEHVNVDVGDCESTCILKISDLPTSGDVDVVVAAFDELGNCELKDIQEIVDIESMTILQKASKNMFIKKVTNPDGNEVHEIVINALCHLDSTSDGAFNIWITNENDTILCQQGADGEGHQVIMYKADCGSDPEGHWNGATAVTNIGELKSGQCQVYVAGQGREPRLLSLDDADIEEQLEKLGIDPASLGPEGTPKCYWISEDSCAQLLDGHMCQGDSNIIIMKMGGNCGSPSGGGGAGANINVNHKPDGSLVAIVTDKDGLVHEIDLSDPDYASQLTALGIEFELQESADGTTRTFTCKSGKAVPESDESDLDQVEKPVPLPDGLELKQNHPNPFNPTTTISFNIPETQAVLLEVYNVNGQKIRTLVDAVVNAGEFSVEWDATDDNGDKVASGIYMYRLTVGDYTTSKKMTLLK